jgi:hypothetical protein
MPAISGASCKIFVANTGVELGWATGCDVTETIQTQRVDVIGQIDSVEIVPVRRTATMSVAMLRISQKPVETPAGGGAWIVGDTADLLSEGALNFAVIDEITGEQICILEGCRPTTRSFRVDSSSLFSENLSFDVRKIQYPSE